MRHEAAILRLGVLVLAADLLLAAAYAGYGEAVYGGDTSADGPLPAVVFWADDDAVGDGTRRAITHALALYRQGTATTLVSVGGDRPAKAFRGAREMDAAFAAAGVPAAHRRQGSGSNDTPTNLRQARAIALDAGWDRVLLVSDPLHVMRMEQLVPEHLHPVEASAAAYGFLHTAPVITPWGLWLRVHREWAAWLAYLLPEGVYGAIIGVLRG